MRLISAVEKVAQNNGGRGKFYFVRTSTDENFIVEEGINYIKEKFNPLSVDMETAAVAYVCFRRSFISVRFITDTFDNKRKQFFEENCVTASEIAKNAVVNMLKEH